MIFNHIFPWNCIKVIFIVKVDSYLKYSMLYNHSCFHLRDSNNSCQIQNKQCSLSLEHNPSWCHRSSYPSEERVQRRVFRCQNNRRRSATEGSRFQKGTTQKISWVWLKTWCYQLNCTIVKIKKQEENPPKTTKLHYKQIFVWQIHQEKF